MSTRAERLLLMIIALALLAFVLAPLMLMVATSLKADEQQILLDFGNFKAFWVNPADMSLENFRQVLNDRTSPVPRYLLNSAFIVISSSVVFFNAVTDVACAYIDPRIPLA